MKTIDLVKRFNSTDRKTNNAPQDYGTLRYMRWKEQITFEVKVQCNRLWQINFHLDNRVSGNDKWNWVVFETMDTPSSKDWFTSSLHNSSYSNERECQTHDKKGLHQWTATTATSLSVWEITFSCKDDMGLNK